MSTDFVDEQAGVQVSDDCIVQYQKFKLGGTVRYVFYKLSDDFSHVMTEKVSPSSATYDDFVKDFPKDDCRYAVYNLEFTTEDGGKRVKEIFFLW